MIHLFLDDLRTCPKGFVCAKNYEECILLLEQCDIDILSLDYDLGPGERTGYDIVKYMVQEGKFARHIYLHTASAAGRMKMYQLLYERKPEHVHLYNHAMPYEVIEPTAGDRQLNELG